MSLSLVLTFISINLTRAKADNPSTAYVALGDQVYEFLGNCVAKGVIPVSSTTVKPLLRSEVSGLLQTILEKYSKLNDRILEADLDYYLREFADDVGRSPSESKPKRSVRSVHYNPADALANPHWHASNLKAENFSFVFDPVIAAGWHINDSDSIFRRATGIQFRGTVSNSLGYYFRFTDHVEKGNGPYESRDQLLEDNYGYVGPLQGGNETYYDLNNAYLVTSWIMFDVMIGKDNLAWGAGDNRLLFSGESPSFTQVRLTGRLTSKIQFCYLLGKLNSWSASGDTLYTTEEKWIRIIPSDKWVVAHRLDYHPLAEVNISVSEALIWGDRGFEPAYLNPLAFLFSAEHDGGDLDNVLLSGDISIKLPGSVIWMGSLLIDDMKTSKLGTDYYGNKFAWSTGLKVYNPGIDGVQTSISYLRIDPYVYSHFFPVNRFSNWTSSLGSSIAPNSDRWSYLVNYRPVRSLTIEFRLQRLRHGDLGESIFDTVVKGEQISAPFLGGKSETWTQYEASVDWEILPGLMVSAGRVENAKTTVLEDRYYVFIGYRY